MYSISTNIHLVRSRGISPGHYFLTFTCNTRFQGASTTKGRGYITHNVNGKIHMQLLDILFHVTIIHVKECNYAINVKYCRAGQSARACTVSKVIRMEGQTERKCDGVGECMSSKCRWLVATSPSVPHVAGIVCRYRRFCSGPSPLNNTVCIGKEKAVVSASYGSSSEFRSEVY